MATLLATRHNFGIRGLAPQLGGFCIVAWQWAELVKGESDVSREQQGEEYADEHQSAIFREMAKGLYGAARARGI